MASVENSRLRSAGVVLVVAGFGVHQVTRRLFRARVRANAERMRAATWLSAPGEGASLAGEMLIWAANAVTRKDHPVTPSG